MEGFYPMLAEILEVDQVQGDNILRDFDNWDSLTVLTILATLDSKYGVNMTAADLRPLKTAAELAAAVEGRRHR